MDRGRIDTKAYELYRADQEGDTDHIDLVNDGHMSATKMKYTQILLTGLPYNATVQCDANVNATIYGYLPTFPFPTVITNSEKYDAAYWYTENGNLTNLNRNDDVGVKTEQDYSYNSGNNQLQNVVWNQQGMTSETHDMSYDANGNILNEAFVGPTPQSPISIGSPEGSFIYDDYDELPRSITTPTGTRNYRYDANGQRIVKEVDANDKNYYLDGVIVDQNNEVVSYQTPEGYVSVSNNGNIVADYFYSIPDWLGTNRAIMDATGNVVNAHDHYPFGKRMPARHMITDAEGNRYQYTSHEFDEETGYGYHGARYYNRELGRYMNVDPLAEDYFSWSSYNYTTGNPINLIDPTGMAPDGWIENQLTGEVSWDNDVTSSENTPEGYTYVSDPNDDRSYTLPNGDGKLIINEWTEYPVEFGAGGVAINMEFVPSPNSTSSGWFQTFASNLPDATSKNMDKVLPTKNIITRLDGPLIEDKTDMENAVYFDVPKSNMLDDMPHRRLNDGAENSVVWFAQSSIVIGQVRSFSIGWGFQIDSKNNGTYSPPTILNEVSDFHKESIKKL